MHTATFQGTTTGDEMSGRTNKPGVAKPDPAKPGATMTEGQLAYEARRAAKAGMSTERWLDSKRKAEAQAAAEQARKQPTAPAKPPGLLKRLLDRAHKPL